MMEERIDLKKFLKIIRKRMMIIILTAISLLGLTAIMTIYVIKPTYEATEYVLVGKLQKVDGEYRDTQDINRLLASSIDFIKSPIVLNTVAEEFNLNDEDKLEEKIIVQNSKDSQIITIVVRDSNGEFAKDLVSFTARTSAQKMNDVFKVNDIQVLRDGETPVERINNPILNLAIGLFLGVFFGIALAMVREYFDDSVKDMDDIEQSLGLPVIGQINLKAKQHMKFTYKKQQKKHGENKMRGRGDISV
jgi:capsular polysaccharide biosynthesis protein